MSFDPIRRASQCVSSLSTGLVLGAGGSAAALTTGAVVMRAVQDPNFAAQYHDMLWTPAVGATGGAIIGAGVGLVTGLVAPAVRDKRLGAALIGAGILSDTVAGGVVGEAVLHAAGMTSSMALGSAAIAGAIGSAIILGGLATTAAFLSGIAPVSRFVGEHLVCCGHAVGPEPEPAAAAAV